MANVPGTFYSAETQRKDVTPSSPPNAVDDPQSPLNPPGSGTTEAFVPYEGASRDVDLGEFGAKVGNVQYDTTPTNIPTVQGSTYWSEDHETVEIVMNGTIGRVLLDTFYHVKNQTGVTIPKGTSVRFAGSLGSAGRLLIAPFLADGTYPSAYYMGVTSEDIVNGGDGKVLHFGDLKGINTSAWAEGTILYASTTVAGGFQSTVPVAPNNIVIVAAVVNQHAVNGIIFIRPTIGSDINNNEGVNIVSVADKDILQYQVGTGVWENKSLSAAGIVGGTIATGQVAFGTASGVIGGDNGIFWDNVNKRLGVGTITPGSLLDLSGVSGTTLSISIPFSAAAYCDILFTSPAVSTYNARIRSTIPGDGTRNLQFITATGAVEGIAMTILGNGNIGIGTIIPTSLLHVVGTTNDGSNLITFVQSGTGRALQIVRGVSGATRAMINFTQNNPAGGSDAVLDIQQATIASPAIKVTNDGDAAVFSVTGGGNMHAVGTVRIGSIANLGTPATNVMVPSATGVQFLRTVTELAGDMSAVQYISQSLTSAQKIQARVNIGSTSATPQIIATAGAINDLAVTSNHLVFTGASVSLSGIVAGLDGEELTLLNASGTSLTVLSEDALSLAANRFNSGVIIPNLSILRIKYRTTSNRWFLENVGINDGRYVRKDVADTKTGDLTLVGNLNMNATNSGFIQCVTSTLGNIGHTFGEGGIQAFRVGRYNANPVLGRGVTSFQNYVVFNRDFFVCSPDLASNWGKFSSDTGRLSHTRSGAENESILRNEKYLNEYENIGTAGAINDQAIAAGFFSQRFSAATSVTGHGNGEHGRELTINNGTSGALTLVHESASSLAVNRYYFIGLADLIIPSRGIATLIYNSTVSRWELKSKNF